MLEINKGGYKFVGVWVGFYCRYNWSEMGVVFQRGKGKIGRNYKGGL